MNWLNNAWIVGIATGMVSGVLVTSLFNLLISKKKDREYQQRIATANRVVIFSVRAGIPENNLPAREMVEALIHSTARRYEVEPTELYQPRELSEELIKEVMDSSFLSQAKKIEYCHDLLPLGREALLAAVNPERQTELITTSEAGGEPLSIQELREQLHFQRLKSTRFEWAVSLAVGLLTAGVTAVFTTRGQWPEFARKLLDFGGSFAKVMSAVALGALFVILLQYVHASISFRSKDQDDKE